MFKELRTDAQVALIAPVMLIARKMYGVDTALLGLMDGARGVVVEGRYAAGSAPPELPEYAIVAFPGNSGRPIFPGAGRAEWAPVPFREAIGKTKQNASRIATPLMLRRAISIAKSQGLTSEGVIVNLCTKSGVSPSGFRAWPTSRSQEQGRSMSSHVADCRSCLNSYNAGIIPTIATASNMRPRRANSAKNLREPQGISPDEEIELHKGHIKEQKMKNLGRDPQECEIKERGDSIKRRCVLAPTPEVVAFCDGEKAGAGSNQSAALRNFTGGESVRQGAKLSDLTPKECGAKRARVEPRPPGVAPVGPVIFACLVDKSSSSIGIPLNTERRRLEEGGKLTIQGKSSGASADFPARPCVWR